MNVQNKAIEQYAEDMPYQLPQVPYMPQEIVTQEVLSEMLKDDDLWVPSSENGCVSFKPLLLSVSGGYFINLLRVKKSGILSRHRHNGPVHAFVLKGRWHYLEHDWVAEENSFAFEPPGEAHTLYVPEDVDEMITLFTVYGGYIYVDPYGKAEGYEDVFTKLEQARAHYRKLGLPDSELEKIIR